jgi:hypothetical protein
VKSWHSRDVYGSNHGSRDADQATVNVDNTRTSSVPNTSSPVYKLLNPSAHAQKPAPQGSDDDLYGN